MVLAKSITAHIVGRNNKKYSNPKELKLSKTKYTLSKGKIARISAKVVLVDPSKKSLSNKHARKYRYASSNTKVARVNKEGVIRGISSGSCKVYVYAKNGYAREITVTVK